MELFHQICMLKASDLQDPTIMEAKKEQIKRSLEKFKKYFGRNLDLLNEREMHKNVSPKFSICFMDLATYLNISLKPIL